VSEVPTREEALAVSPGIPLACPQDVVEPIMLWYLLDHGREALFRTELASLDQDADGVIADFATATSARRGPSAAATSSAPKGCGVPPYGLPRRRTGPMPADSELAQAV
jgi:hypothetical protein